MKNLSKDEILLTIIRTIYYTIGALLLSSSTIVLALVYDLRGALYYGIINACALPFYENPYTVIAMNALQDYQQQSNILGHIIAREYMTNIGRIVGMSTVFLFALFMDQDSAVAAAVILCSCCPIIQVAAANIYHRKRDQKKLQTINS